MAFKVNDSVMREARKMPRTFGEHDFADNYGPHKTYEIRRRFSFFNRLTNIPKYVRLLEHEGSYYIVVTSRSHKKAAISTGVGFCLSSVAAFTSLQLQNPSLTVVFGAASIGLGLKGQYHLGKKYGISQLGAQQEVYDPSDRCRVISSRQAKKKRSLVLTH